MLRFIVTALITIVLIGFVRSVVGIIMKALTGGAASNPKEPRASSPNQAATGGSLRRCPMCGTYTSESIALKRIRDGETIYYCSAECEQKSKASA